MGRSVLDRGLRSNLVLDFWLAQSTAALLGFQKNTVLPVLTFQHVYLTQLRDRNLSHSDLHVSPRSCPATPSLDIMVGEVDELEEDVG